MRRLAQEAKEKKYPDTGLMKSLLRAVAEAEKCAGLATQLASRGLRQPLQTTTNLGNKRTKLSIKELELFLNQISLLPCIIEEGALIVVSVCLKLLSHVLTNI